MPSVRIRNLDEQVVTELKDRAKRHGNTFENELRALLTDEAFRPRREAAKRAHDVCESIKAKVGTLADSTPYIREWRDGL
jgi:plasmid stability protein